jgi:hypothetical protein
MLLRTLLVIALSSVPAVTQGTSVFDLRGEAQGNSGSGPQPVAYQRVIKLYRKYNGAGQILTAGRLRAQFLGGLGSIGRLETRDAQAAVIGKLVYFAARLPERSDEIDLLADILAYCPGAASVQFIYGSQIVSLTGPAVPEQGDIYKTLREGVYLGTPPNPWDENSRIGVKDYEIPAWDARSVEDLKQAVASRRPRPRI